jgi:polyisoprenyl-phosphate glycosyltransferase
METMISIISPVYKAEKILSELVKRIKDVCQNHQFTFEIILVEDASPDNSWQVIEQLANETEEVIGIEFSRNFGQHAAITADIENSIGDHVIMMDCYLQDDPKHIPHLLSKATEGFDVVISRKQYRQYSPFKNITAKLFNKEFNWLVWDLNYMSADSSVGAYSLLSRKIADAFCQIKDYRRHYFSFKVSWLLNLLFYYRAQQKI